MTSHSKAMERRDVQKDKNRKNGPKAKDKEKNKIQTKVHKGIIVAGVLSAPKGIKKTLKSSKRVLNILFIAIQKYITPGAKPIGCQFFSKSSAARTVSLIFFPAAVPLFSEMKEKNR